MRTQIVRRLSGRTARRAAVVGAAGALVISVGVGVATAAPGDGGEIAACYQNTTGAMRAVDAGEQCKQNETRLVWSSGSAADLPDGSVTGGPGGVVEDDSLTKDDLGSDSVESDELADDSVGTAELADDSVKGGSGGVVQDGGITVFDLAVDSVNGSKIADGTVGTDDLADGAATADKLKANFQTGITQIVDLTTPTTRTVNSATLTTSANHTLMVLGQAQLVCSTCAPGDSVSATWQVFEGAVPVSGEYEAILSTTNPTAPASVSTIIPDSGSAGAHTYDLRVTVSSPGTETVTFRSDTLSVVDLGQ
jgi:hypothetical protein